MSVLLTNWLPPQRIWYAVVGSWENPDLVTQLGGQGVVDGFLAEAGDAFASTFWVAWVLVLLTLIPVAFLPRRREESRMLDTEAPTGAAAAPPPH